MSKDFRSRSGMRGFSLARCAEKFAVWLHFALYVNTAAAILLFMSMYAPIVLLCSNVGRLTLIMFAFETLRPNGETCVRSQKRKHVLAERKEHKKAYRRYRRHVRLWRECKRVLIEKYGNVSCALLCVPWIFRCVLFCHVLLTWWISISLRVNTTELLEEKWLRFMARELYEHGKQQEQNLQRFAFHRVPTMKLIRKAMTLEQLRAIQGKRWRLLMDPRFRRRVERSLRRRQARHRRMRMILTMWRDSVEI